MSRSSHRSPTAFSVPLASVLAALLCFFAASPAQAAGSRPTGEEKVSSKSAAAEKVAPSPWKSNQSRVVVLDTADELTSEFVDVLPAGAHLAAADATQNTQSVTSSVMVIDAGGAPIGAWDEPVAMDASMELLETSFNIENGTLFQSVVIDDTVTFPVTVLATYSPIGGSSGVSPQPTGTFTTAAYVGIPSNYVYNPSLGSLHDYCTSSPDEFPNPTGSNANFRGPCARHDLCYAGSTSEFTCDNRLLADMRSNCAYSYSWYNPTREACYRTADLSWTAVLLAR